MDLFKKVDNDLMAEIKSYLGENFEQNDEYIQEYIIQHELSHVFGILKDQHITGSYVNTDMHKGYTYINAAVGSKINMPTPYDMSSILALYTPQAKNKADLKEKIAFCKDYLIEYETKYYDYFTERNKQNKGSFPQIRGPIFSC